MKELFCVSASPFSWTGRGGELAKAAYTMLGGNWGARAGRQERRLWGNIFPWWEAQVAGEREEAHLHRCWDSWKENQRECGISVFFTKTAKAVESTVCIGKMSLEGAKKHMWDWEHLLYEAAWKTTEQQQRKTESAACSRPLLGGEGRGAARPSWCKAGHRLARPVPRHQGGGNEINRQQRGKISKVWGSRVALSSKNEVEEWRVTVVAAGFEAYF